MWFSLCDPRHIHQPLRRPISIRTKHYGSVGEQQRGGRTSGNLSRSSWSQWCLSQLKHSTMIAGLQEPSVGRCFHSKLTYLHVAHLQRPSLQEGRPGQRLPFPHADRAAYTQEAQRAVLRRDLRCLHLAYQREEEHLAHSTSAVHALAHGATPAGGHGVVDTCLRQYLDEIRCQGFRCDVDPLSPAPLRLQQGALTEGRPEARCACQRFLCGPAQVTA